MSLLYFSKAKSGKLKFSGALDNIHDTKLWLGPFKTYGFGCTVNCDCEFVSLVDDLECKISASSLKNDKF